MADARDQSDVTERSDATERFSDVYKQCYPRVLAYARRRSPDAVAADVVSETFLAAWRHVERLPDEPLPWLYRTARQCLRNQARSQRRQQRLADRMAQLPVTGFLSADHADAVAETRQLMTALTRLSDSDREALLLVAWEGLEPAAAAYVLDCSTVAFRVRLHRARRRLADLLDDPEPANSLAHLKEA